MQMPPGLAKEDRRVQTVSYSFDNPTRYIVTGSRILTGDAAAFDLVWRLWRRFEIEEEAEVPLAAPAGGGEGGMATLLIAAHNASEYSIAKADLWSSGSIAGAVINQAIALLADTGGTIWLSEGWFTATERIDVPSNIHLRGFGAATTLFTDPGNDEWGVEVATQGQLSDLTISATTGSAARIFESGGE